LIEARPLPAADPPITYAQIDKAARLLGFAPRTTIETGLENFWRWYCEHVRI
jgi:UDP-glucuronate 4-epimerase